MAVLEVKYHFKGIDTVVWLLTQRYQFPERYTKRPLQESKKANAITLFALLFMLHTI